MANDTQVQFPLPVVVVPEISPASRSGVPLNLVQKWLGHARMETTAIYTQALGVEDIQIAARMWS